MSKRAASAAPSSTAPPSAASPSAALVVAGRGDRSDQIRSAQEAIERIIRTPQELVHIRHSISLSQYKVWVLMLRAFRQKYEREGDKALGEDMCYVSMSTISEYFGYLPKTAALRQDMEAIRKEPILFNLLSKDGRESQIGQGFISMWHVTSARVGVVFPPVIRHAVRDMDSRASIFHNLNWAIFHSMAGKYEAILYKLCKDYVGVGRTPYMGLEVFRSYVGLQDGEYADFKQLSQWVITRPIKRINENPLADIEISCEYRRQGRRVVGVQFLASPKLQGVIDFGDDPAFLQARISIALSQQQKYLREYGSERVEGAIRRANVYGQEQEAAGREVNYGGLYRRAIEEDWGAEQQSRLLKEQEARREEALRLQQAQQQAQRQRLEAAMQDLQNEFMLISRGKAIKALTPQQVQQLAQEYAQDSASAVAGDFNAASGKFSDRITDGLFRIWLKTAVKVEFDKAAFREWLLESKGIDPASIGLDI